MGRSRTVVAATAACIVAAACGNQPDPADQPDCGAAEARLDACLGANAAKGSRAFLLACIPYSKPQRIAGTWAGDFEYNVFFDGQQVTVDRALSAPTPSVVLEGAPDLEKDSAGRKQTTVEYIEFDGRRPLCNLDPGHTVLVVDRIVSRRIIRTQPSPWYPSP